MSFVEAHHKESLKDHFLEAHVDTENLKAWYLRDGKQPKSRMMSTLILFTVEGIVIMGDLCPGQNGVISCLGYGLDWFSEHKSEHYLCEKFLSKTFVPEKAYRTLRESILEHRREEFWTKEKARELWDENEDRVASFGEPWNAHEFYDIYARYGLEYDGQGYGYDPSEAGWLCAIQQKFSESYLAQLAVTHDLQEKIAS
jgi:hypothetical protein